MAIDPRIRKWLEVWGAKEVCHALDVSKMTLSRWRRAGDFPEPWRVLDMGPIWLAEDVRAWQRARRVSPERMTRAR